MTILINLTIGFVEICKAAKESCSKKRKEEEPEQAKNGQVSIKDEDKSSLNDSQLLGLNEEKSTIREGPSKQVKVKKIKSRSVRS